MTNATPVRVLHLTNSLNVGGIETWLIRVLRHTDRNRLAMDIAVYDEIEGPLAEEARQLGAKVFCGPSPGNPLRSSAYVKRVLREHGPYDVVHAHVAQTGGFVLRTAYQAGVPIRIAHAHNDWRRHLASASTWWRLYHRLMQLWINRHATLGLACSTEAGLSLFGSDWPGPNHHVLPCGIDLEPFERPVDAAQLRRELGIPPDAPVIGHVGRFAEQKNHRFLIEIMAHVHRLNPDARLLLCGDGPLRPEIERQVTACGLASHVVFAGIRSDIPQLMKGAMDCFVLPSHHEGLGIVNIEAQAAGLPLVLADTVPTEAAIIKEAVYWHTLNDGPNEWADTIAWLLVQRIRTSSQVAITKMGQTPYDIQNCLARLDAFYRLNLPLNGHPH